MLPYTLGPDLGVASLTFQAFYEAKYGEAAWEGLDKIPKEEWMAYLMWYRWVGGAHHTLDWAGLTADIAASAL